MPDQKEVAMTLDPSRLAAIAEIQSRGESMARWLDRHPIVGADTFAAMIRELVAEVARLQAEHTELKAKTTNTLLRDGTGVPPTTDPATAPTNQRVRVRSESVDEVFVVARIQHGCVRLTIQDSNDGDAETFLSFTAWRTLVEGIAVPAVATPVEEHQADPSRKGLNKQELAAGTEIP